MTSLRVSHSSFTVPATAACVGLGAGALTAYLQGVLPVDWNTVANSGAVWTAVTYAGTLALARTRGAAALAGLLLMTGEVAGYYLYLADVRHLAAGHAAELLWTLAALWIGPLTGVAAFHARFGDPAQRMAARVALAGVLAGEGLYLVRDAGVPTSGRVEIALAVVLTAATIGTREARMRARFVALAVGAAVASAVFIAYRLLALG
jgi:hypothetical protein